MNIGILLSLVVRKKTAAILSIDNRRQDEDRRAVTGAENTFHLVGMFDNTGVLGGHVLQVTHLLAHGLLWGQVLCQRLR